MKSKILIDVDESNRPIIEIQYVPSEDLRDKMIKRFLESFGGDSSWAFFSYDKDRHPTPNSRAYLIPIEPSTIPEHVEGMYREARNQLVARRIVYGKEECTDKGQIYDLPEIDFETGLAVPRPTVEYCGGFIAGTTYTK